MAADPPIPVENKVEQMSIDNEKVAESKNINNDDKTFENPPLVTENEG